MRPAKSPVLIASSAAIVAAMTFGLTACAPGHPSDPAELVDAWLKAAGDRDIERLQELSGEGLASGAEEHPMLGVEEWEVVAVEPDPSPNPNGGDECSRVEVKVKYDLFGTPMERATASVCPTLDGELQVIGW